VSDTTIRSQSGKPLHELSIGALREGRLSAEDFRISGETLRRQADAAEAAGYRHLAQNLRRAAELTGLSNQQVFTIYNALRPGRSSYRQLCDLADQLERDHMMPLTAAFVREAAEAYRKRGLTSDG